MLSISRSTTLPQSLLTAEAEYISHEIQLAVDQMIDYIANDPETGDGSGTPISNPEPPINSPPERAGSFISDTHGVSRQLFVEDREGDITILENERIQNHAPDPQWRLSRQHDELVSRGEGHSEACSLCGFSGAVVQLRDGVDDFNWWRCCGSEADVNPEYVCNSCTYPGRSCSTCGVSEEYFKSCQQFRFDEIAGIFHGNTDHWSFVGTHCLSCAVDRGLLGEDEYSENVIDNDDDSLGVIMGPSLPGFLDEGDRVTYVGEFENEDPPENNSENMREIKDAVKDMGELVFDIQEQLKEGDYLKLMDHLQKITNIANS